MAGGTQSKSGGGKSASKPPPEIKEVIAPSLQFARIRCACDACDHAPPGQAPTGTQAPTGWFRGLYVLLAKNPPPPPPAKEGEKPAVPEKPVFTLWATDGDGYLSPLGDAAAVAPPPPAPPPNPTPAGQTAPAAPAAAPPEEPKAPEIPEAPGAIADPGKAVPLVPGEEYLLYLVLHPDKEVAEDFLKQANGAGIKDGAPFLKKLVLERERTGEMLDKKKNTKTIVEEPVFKVTDTAFLTAPGGDLYGGFTLFSVPFQRKFFATDSRGNKFAAALPFRAMPNNYCPHVKEQVVRLQAHLGALRFPVGTPANPYFSQRQDALTVALQGPNDKSPNDYKIVFENPGAFDALTYNAVLSFQRHAAGGRYVQLKEGQKLYGEMFEGERFALKGGPRVADNAFARRMSVGYLELDPASDEPWNAAPLGAPEFKGDATGVCDPETAKEIRRWLEKGLRKAGHVMRAIFPQGKFPDGRAVKSGGASEWMRDDGAPVYLQWVDAARSLGAPQDVLGTHVFRDIRDMITGKAAGKIRNSIHKTGLAVDTAPVNGFLNQHPDYAPIVTIEPDKQKNRKGEEIIKIRWRLFEDVTKVFNEAVHGPARDDFARQHGLDAKELFRREIAPWEFDAADPDGGQSLPTIKGLFVDITRIAAALGWNRISAQSGMGSSKGTVVRIEATKKKTHADAVNDALVAIERARAQSRKLEVMVERPSAKMTMVAQAGSLDTALLKRWMFSMQLAGFAAQPEVVLDLPFFVQPVDRPKLEQIIHDEFGFDPFVVGLKSPAGVVPLEGADGRSVLLVGNPDVALVVPALGPLWIQSGDIVTTFKVGIPRTREWWHFQHDAFVGKKTADKTEWFQALEKIGWEKEGLRALGYIEEDITP